MISSACAQLGERALVCAAGSDYSNVPHSEHVKVVGVMNYAAALPACRAFVHHGGCGHHERGPARGTPDVDPLDVARSGALGSAGQTTESRYWTALFGHHREIAGRGPAHRPGPAMPHPRPASSPPG